MSPETSTFENIDALQADEPAVVPAACRVHPLGVVMPMPKVADADERQVASLRRARNCDPDVVAPS
jgi:hypothetical protein